MARNPMTPEELHALRASMVRGAIDAVRQRLDPPEAEYLPDEWSEDYPSGPDADGNPDYETLSWSGPEVLTEGKRLAGEIAELIRGRFPDARQSGAADSAEEAESE